jgi:hypothetical protein
MFPGLLRSRNSPGFDHSILQHSGIWRAADEAVLNTLPTWEKIQKILLLNVPNKLGEEFICLQIFFNIFPFVFDYIQYIFTYKILKSLAAVPICTGTLKIFVNQLVCMVL